MRTTEIITLAVSACALLLTGLLLAGACLVENPRKKGQRWFFAMLLCNLLGAGCEITTACLVGHPGPAIAKSILLIDFANYVLGSLFFIAFILYLYEYLSMKAKVSQTPFRLSVLCNLLNILLLLLTQIPQLPFLLDEYNHYVPSSFVWMAQILPVISMVLLTTATLRSIKPVRSKECAAILLYFLIMLTCYCVETWLPGIWISYLGSAIALFIMYINIQVDLRHQMKAQELELTESRIAVMLSQIQSHFLYNTLGAIDKLYFENPEEGHQALVKFSAYLRGNMASVSSTMPIPFTEELSHVQQYLWLEKLRFEENLQVEYDIQADAFALPVLSLQPLVENAVRHGVTKKKAGGKIILRTRETKDCYTIEVLDDGVGFDPAAPLQDGRNHLGIANVRERLRTLCGGRLILHSAPGQGTTIRMEIPKEGMGQ